MAGRKYILVDEIRDTLERLASDTRATRIATENAVTSLNAEVKTLQKALAKQAKKYETLQTAVVKTMTFLFQLLDDPDARAHAEAVVKDYRFNASKIDNE